MKLITEVCISSNIGYALQLGLIVWSFAIWTVYGVHLNRYYNKTTRNALDTLYFMVITILVVEEGARVIDPFSMNGVYSIKMNRMFLVFVPCWTIIALVSLIVDTYLAMLYRIRKQLRSPMHRYLALTNFVLFITIPSVFVIISFSTIQSDDTLQTIFTVYLLWMSVLILCTMCAQEYLVTRSIQSGGLISSEAHGSNDRKNEILQHAQERLVSSLRARGGVAVVIALYLIVEVAMGAAVTGDCYFIPGLFIGVVLRIGPLMLMKEQWIGIDDLRDDEEEAPLTWDRMTTGQYLNAVAGKVNIRRIQTLNMLFSVQSENEVVDADSGVALIHNDQ
eukprot:50632_1